MSRSAFAVRSATNKTPSENKVVVVLPEVTTILEDKQTKKNNSSSKRKRRRINDESVAASEAVIADEHPDTRHTGNAITQDQPSIQESNQEHSSLDQINTDGGALPYVSDSHIEPVPAVAAQKVSGIDINWDSSYRNVDVKLPAGQSLAIVGEYDIWIRKGSISILGSTVHSGTKLHRVYAPTTHSIPVLRALTNPFGPPLQTAEVRIQSVSSGIRKLRNCNTRFSRIWYQGQENMASFGLLRSGGMTQDPRFLVPTDWEKHANALCDNGKLPVIMICGPKNAGKSSFARFLTNSFLSRRYAASGVAYLDLDPGQPEYTTPADLSLVHVKTYNLGPPFTHLADPESEHNRLIRQHHFGYFSPREDLGHYLDCAKNLYEHYKQWLRQLGCPLIINTSGWTQGLGLEVLLSLTKLIMPTHVFNLASSEIDDESGSVLQQSVAKIGTSFTVLSARNNPSGPRSAADLRSMQFSSFFHLDTFESGRPRWNPEMLSFSETISLPYSGQEKIISGVLLLGNHVNYEMLEAAIDKTVLALVVVQQSSPLHELLHATKSNESPDAAESDTEMQNDSANDFEVDDADPNDEDRTTPRYELNSNKQGIPYLVYNTRLNPPIDPATCYSLGQVMLNQINTEQKTFDVHTSIPSSTIKSALEQGMELILVRGQLGMPEWAYLEEYSLSKAIQEDGAELQQQSKSDSTFGLDLESLAQRTPYVECEDHQGMGGLNKTRRVRRNLGTTSNKV